MLRTVLLDIFLAAAGHAVAERPVAIAIHGGAGTILPEHMCAEKEGVMRAALEQAVRAVHEVLTSDGTALDAAIAAIRFLVDSPEFNAGRGAVLTNTGTVEMDASIMDGKTLQAGAVASV